MKVSAIPHPRALGEPLPNRRAKLRSLLRALVTIVLLAIAHAAHAGYYDTVRPGDTLTSFAKRNGVTIAQVTGANRLTKNSKIIAGTKLYVPKDAPGAARAPKSAAANAAKTPAPPVTAEGTWHTVQSGESLTGVAKKYGLTREELARANGMSASAQLQVGRKLRIPPKLSGGGSNGGGGQSGAAASSPPKPREAAPPETVVEVPGGGERRTGTPRPSRRGYIWPVEGRVIQRFVNNSVEKHFGLEIAAPTGTPVRAARDGTVIFSSDSLVAYGLMVIVEHDGGFVSCYAHLQGTAVRKGQRVRQGDTVGRVGTTPKTRQAALHFEVRRNGIAVNPEDYLP